MVNFDANAGLEPLPVVKAAIVSAIESGTIGTNPSSMHRFGQRARALIEDARAKVAQAVGAASNAEVIFTSGASEANNTILTAPFWGLLGSSPSPRDLQGTQCITTSIEHPCVLEACTRLERMGITVAYVEPRLAEADFVDQIAGRVTPDTKVVSVMLANNETGVVLPVKEIARAVRARNADVLLHVDAAQALGKIPLECSSLGVDALSISGHKIGALSGVGALVLAPGVSIPGLIVGGAQEKRMRAGTENTVGILSFGVAAAVLNETFRDFHTVSSAYVLRLRDMIREVHPAARFIAEQAPRLPNTLSVQLAGVRADDFVVALDLEGVRISSGAACSSGKPQASHVLLAMGMTPQEAKETIRLSIAPGMTEDVFQRGFDALKICLQRFLALAAARV